MKTALIMVVLTGLTLVVGGRIMAAPMIPSQAQSQLQSQSQPPPQPLIVCSEDVIPNNMIIVATGTSPACRGSCRARKVEPVRGSIMIVCANQAVPERWVLDSVTTSPDCTCLGDEDNAYVIKLNETHENDEESIPTAAPTPAPGQVLPSPPDFRTGE